jgi:hypothetical protein
VILAWAWVSVGATAGVVLLYEVLLVLLQRRRPERLARSKHARLREDWFLAVSAQKGAEVLAVQTLRNSLMSATVLASTAALALMGTVTMAAPSLHASLDIARGISDLSPRLISVSTKSSDAVVPPRSLPGGCWPRSNGRFRRR